MSISEVNGHNVVLLLQNCCYIFSLFTCIYHKSPIIGNISTKHSNFSGNVPQTSGFHQSIALSFSSDCKPIFMFVTQIHHPWHLIVCGTSLTNYWIALSIIRQQYIFVDQLSVTSDNTSIYKKW